jgi:hypothetical protein
MTAPKPPKKPLEPVNPPIDFDAVWDREMLKALERAAKKLNDNTQSSPDHGS